MPIGSPKEFIESVLPDQLAGSKRLEGLDFALQFEITGENGGQWVLEVREGRAAVWTGTGGQAGAEITIKMKDDNFVKMVNGGLSGPKAFMTGKLKFKGEMSAALKLQKLGIV